MTYKLTEEQESIRDMVREYARKRLAPKADEVDKSGKFPKDTMLELAEMGVMGLNVPEEYGGAGLDEVSKALVIAEVSACCGNTAEFLPVHYLTNDIIARFGNEEQKQKYLTQACNGKLGAFALTEPGAGSDAAAVKTRAESDGDYYVINGTKCFISNMGPDEGDYVILFASTQPEKGVKGLTAILVDRCTPGFTLGKSEDKMGIRGASVSELIFEDCRVPKANRLGEEGQGFKIAMKGLEGGRVCIAAQGVGLAQGALEAAVKYAHQRVQFGKPIAANQGIQWYVAEMATRTEAARALTLQAADARQNNDPQTIKLASMAKFFASETAVAVASKALQIHGGYGYMKDYAIERMYRDARIIPIYEGTSEVQKMVISKEVYRELV